MGSRTFLKLIILTEHLSNYCNKKCDKVNINNYALGPEDFDRHKYWPFNN